MADEAVNSSNHAEAYNYYTKIVETDPNNYRAWYGKAISAGWQSTLANLRLPETINGLDNALKYAPENEKDDLKVKIALSLGKLAWAIFVLVGDNFEAHITLESHREYISRVQLIITVMEIASIYKPDDRQILHNIIFMLLTCTRLYINNITSETVELTGSAYNDVIKQIQEIEKKIQQLDPNYVPLYPATEGNPASALPITNKKACFIATAAYGSPMATEVVMLREFRDHFFETTHWGQTLVKVYYYLSPPIAGIINRNQILKAVARKILNPIICIVKKYYRGI